MLVSTHPENVAIICDHFVVFVPSKNVGIVEDQLTGKIDRIEVNFHRISHHDIQPKAIFHKTPSHPDAPLPQIMSTRLEPGIYDLDKADNGDHTAFFIHGSLRNMTVYLPVIAQATGVYMEFDKGRSSALGPLASGHKWGSVDSSVYEDQNHIIVDDESKTHDRVLLELQLNQKFAQPPPVSTSTPIPSSPPPSIDDTQPHPSTPPRPPNVPM